MNHSHPPTRGHGSVLESLEPRRLFNFGPATDVVDSDIAYGADGTIHAVYTRVYTATDGITWSDVYYTKQTSGSTTWTTPYAIRAFIVTGSNVVGQYIDIAINPVNGLPGVTYYDSQNAELYYQYANSSGGWVYPPEAVEDTSALYPSLTYTSAGAPYISYYYNKSGVSDTKNLKVATYNPSTVTWTRQTVDSTGDVGRSSTLITAPNGMLAVVYERTDTGQYKYAYKSGSNWVIEVAADTNSGGGHTSLAFDGWGQPAISYYDAYNADLMFAHRNQSGGGWLTPRKVSGDKGTHTDLFFDQPRNRFLLTATHPNSDQSLLWTSATLAGGVLTTFGVNALSTGAGKRLASAFRLDASNRADIAYTLQSMDNNDFYIRRRPGSLQDTPTSMSASPFSSTQITLSWSDNTSNENGYFVERSTDGGTTFTQIASLAANAESYTAGGLSAGTTYHFRVRAFAGTSGSPWGYSAYSPSAGATTNP